MAINPSLLIVPYRYKAAKLYSQLPESGAGDFTVTRGTTATRVNASGLIESVASGVPRLDYAGGGCPSLLVEPAATNLFRDSEPATDPGQGVRTNVAFEANTWGIGLDGSVVFTNNSFNRIYQNTASLTGAHTLFFIAKRDDGAPVTDADIRGMFNNAAATTTFTPYPLGSGLYLGRAYSASVSGASNGILKDTGRTANRVEVSAIMILAGDIAASSYIKTTGSTVTRNADVISLSSVSGLIGQSAGTIYAEVNATNFIDGARIFELSDTTANNNISLRKQSSSRLRALVTTASGTVADISTASGQVAGTYKIALAYAANDFVLYVNGTQIGTDTSGAVPATSKVNFGSGAADGNQLNDRIAAAAIYTSRLSNSELQSLTTL